MNVHCDPMNTNGVYLRDLESLLSSSGLYDRKNNGGLVIVYKFCF